MSSEWVDVTLGEFAEINPKRPVSKGAIAKFIEMAALPTNARDIQQTDIVDREFKSGGAKFRNGDTLLARITPCLENGKTALVSGLSEGECAFGSTEFIVLGAKNEDDQRFLYYLARSEEFRAYAIARMEGTSGRQRVPNAAVAEYRFNCPPQYLRKEIGKILGSLDDRIALLRETNTTLEAIAQALFKSWFVDFDPVHANAAFLENGQAPSLPAEIQALFPSRLVESQQGLIPEGWEFKKFSDVIDKYIDNRGKTPPTVDEGIPLLEIKHLPENEISPSVNTDKKVSQETYDTWFRAHPMKNDILMSTVGTIGRLSIMGNQRVAIAQNILGLRVGDVVAPEYMYYLMKDNKFKSDVNARLVITVQASIKRKDLNTIDVLVPSKAAQSLFIDTVSQLIEKQRKNDEQAQNLANLRDTLLPRLISGQLRLPEAKESLAELG